MSRNPVLRPVRLLLTAMTAAAILVMDTARSIVTQEKSEAAVRRAAAEPVPFILREENGVVVLGRGNSSSPALITDIRVQLLPPDDQEALREGIRLLSSQEAYAVLSDFSG